MIGAEVRIFRDRDWVFKHRSESYREIKACEYEDTIRKLHFPQGVFTVYFMLLDDNNPDSNRLIIAKDERGYWHTI